MIEVRRETRCFCCWLLVSTNKSSYSMVSVRNYTKGCIEIVTKVFFMKGKLKRINYLCRLVRWDNHFYLFSVKTLLFIDISLRRFEWWYLRENISWSVGLNKLSIYLSKKKQNYCSKVEFEIPLLGSVTLGQWRVELGTLM